MKTSNILLLTAILIFLSYLVVYDFGLKSEYNSIKKMGLANYQKNKRFVEYQSVKVGAFENVNLEASNIIDVRVEYGEKEAVYVLKHLNEVTRISHTGHDLTIGLVKKDDSTYYPNRDFAVVVISPKIKKVTTSSFSKTDDYWNHRNEISGFTQDSLSVFLQDMTKIDLIKNKFKRLTADVGTGMAGGNLFVADDNKIESVKLTVKGKSSVVMLNTDIKSLEKQLSDSANVTFKGSIINKMIK